MRTRPEAGYKVEAASPEEACHNITARTMRQANRTLVLNLIREHAPVSRTALSVLSGIHRSNVTLIANELVQSGLVDEARGTAHGRGRVPDLLSLNVQLPVVLGINVRPAQVTGLLATMDGSTEEVFAFPTPKQPAHLMDLLREHCLHNRAARARIVTPVRQVVVAVPGRVLPDEGLWMPDFPHYAHFNLTAALKRMVRKPVSLVNAGNVAALAAMRLERGNRTDNLAFVAVHDYGVGGGIITDRKLYAGCDGTFAGEFGHMVVSGDGPRCACGNVGCWGELLSNRAVWRHLVRHGVLASACTRTYEEETYRNLLQQVNAQPDHACRPALKPIITALANGLRNINNILNPREIVIAGELTAAWGLLEEELRLHPTFPDVSRKLTAARMPLAELYAAGTVQHGLETLFASTVA